MLEGMQAVASRYAPPMRRARVPCPRCGERIELSRMRIHLREYHQVGSADLESTFLSARKAARRGSRPIRRI
jgi:hypothetical protein